MQGVIQSSVRTTDRRTGIAPSRTLPLCSSSRYSLRPTLASTCFKTDRRQDSSLSRFRIRGGFTPPGPGFRAVSPLILTLWTLRDAAYVFLTSAESRSFWRWGATLEGSSRIDRSGRRNRKTLRRPGDGAGHLCSGSSRRRCLGEGFHFDRHDLKISDAQRRANSLAVQDCAQQCFWTICGTSTFRDYGVDSARLYVIDSAGRVAFKSDRSPLDYKPAELDPILQKLLLLLGAFNSRLN